MYFTIINYILISIFCGYGVSAVSITFGNSLISQHGVGWPPTLNVAEGNEALMKLSATLDNQQSCTVTSPTGLTFDVSSPPGNEYQKWSDGCGVRLRGVKLEDEGRWRLTASRGNDSITGWIELSVLENINTYQAAPINLIDGQTQAFVNLSTLHNSYCVVAKPFTESSLVPGHCNLTLDRTTRSIQGNWEILLGLPGQVSEIRTLTRVAVEAERLDVGYVNDVNANSLHLYCNILHATKNISFCRFQKTSESYGYNVVDGLGDGIHSYYGEGFAQKQCGITIENPTAQDYGTWRCSVGVSMLINGLNVHQQPLQALISVPATGRSLDWEQSQHNEENTKSTLFVQENMPFSISCQAEVSLTYCWFQHPNGSQFTPVNLADENQLFWYSGESLQTGDCGITFSHASAGDAGLWLCHMGPRDLLGLEITEQVELRVTGPLAANQKEVAVTVGEPTTLFCHSSNGNSALQYCRFLSPQFVGIHIDSSVTQDNAIMGRFYFTPDRDIMYGDCSLSITSVQREDLGIWTCAAVVDIDTMESRDTVTLYVDHSSAPRFRAGIIGMSVGLSVLVVVLVGYLAFKRGWIPYTWGHKRQTNMSSIPDTFSTGARSSLPESISSDESENNRR